MLTQGLLLGLQWGLERSYGMLGIEIDPNLGWLLARQRPYLLYTSPLLVFLHLLCCLIGFWGTCAFKPHQVIFLALCSGVSPVDACEEP